MEEGKRKEKIMEEREEEEREGISKWDECM